MDNLTFDIRSDKAELEQKIFKLIQQFEEKYDGITVDTIGTVRAPGYGEAKPIFVGINLTFEISGLKKAVEENPAK